MVKYLLIEISIYDPEVFQILRDHGYVYGISIGFDPLENRPVNYNTNYMRTPIYHSTLDDLQETMRTHVPKAGRTNQMMLLLYKTKTPFE